MNQMGESIEELLEKSRQTMTRKSRRNGRAKSSWLDNPLPLFCCSHYLFY